MYGGGGHDGSHQRVEAVSETRPQSPRALHGGTTAVSADTVVATAVT